MGAIDLPDGGNADREMTRRRAGPAKGKNVFLGAVAVFASFAGTICIAQDAVPREMLDRTVYVKTVAGSATAFKIDRHGHVYLVTARHVVNRVPRNGATIQMRKDGEWKDLSITKIIFPKSVDVDIAVMATTETRSTPYAIDVPSSTEGPTMGQSVWFLGYPLVDGLSSRGGGGEFPFIKKGAVAAVDASHRDAVIFYIDGMNNHGFSGGPVLYWDFNSHAYRLLSVVSGFRYERADAEVNGAAVQSQTLLNSGILLSYSLQHAIDAIDEDVRATTVAPR